MLVMKMIKKFKVAYRVLYIIPRSPHILIVELISFKIKETKENKRGLTSQHIYLTNRHHDLTSLIKKN